MGRNKSTYKNEVVNLDSIFSGVIRSKQSSVSTKTSNVNIVDVITFSKVYLDIDFSKHPYMEIILKLFYIKTLGNDNLVIDDEDKIKLKDIHNYSKYIYKKGITEIIKDEDEEDLNNSENYLDQDMNKLLLKELDEGKKKTNFLVEDLSKEFGGNYWLGEKLKILTSETTKRNPFHYLVLALGRRSGKSYLCAIIATYEVYKLLSLITCMNCKEHFNLLTKDKCPKCGEILINNPQAYYGLRSSENLRIILAATKRDQAIDPMLNYIEMFVSSCDFFEGKWHRNDSEGAIYFKTEYDDVYNKKRLEGKQNEYRGSVIIKTVGGNAKGQHGMGAVLAILDEFALFNSEGIDTDAAVIDAIVPASSLYRELKGDGRIVMLSMPEYPEGKFYEHYYQGIDLNNKYFKQHLVFQMPTWEYNTNFSIDSLIDNYGSDFGGDPTSTKFKQIYGGQFITSGAEILIPEKYIMLAIDGSNYIKERPQNVMHRHYMHIDCASSSANYAYLIGHWEVDRNGTDNSKIFVEDTSFYWTPSQIREGFFEGKDGTFVSIDNLLIEIIKAAKIYNVSCLSYDLMQSQESKFRFHTSGIKLKQISFGGYKSGELYGLVLQLFLEKKIRLCCDDKLLVEELKNLRKLVDVRKRGLRVNVGKGTNTRTKDLADCLAGAVYSSYLEPMGRNAGLAAVSVYSVRNIESLYTGFNNLPNSLSSSGMGAIINRVNNR